MADKNLTIQVIYDDNGATAKLKQLDAEMDHVGTTAATKTTPAVSGMSTMLKGALVGAAITAAYEIGQLAVELLRMGDEIQRVSDRTGLSIKAVQQLGFVAQQSGNSLDQITAAIGQMQNRLASGDKSAVAALQALNLSLEELQTLAPDAQFYRIAEAIAAIEDPMVRTQLAMDVFGRSGAQILPTITAELRKLREEAPVMSDATVRALDEAGDRIQAIGLKAKVAAAEGFNKLYDSAKLLFGYFSGAGPRVMMSNTPGKDITLAPKKLLTDYTVTVKATTAATTAAHKETRTFADALQAVSIGAKATVPALREMDGILVGMGERPAIKLPFEGWATDPLVGTDLSGIMGLPTAGLGNMTGFDALTGGAEEAEKTVTFSVNSMVKSMELLSRAAEMMGDTTSAAMISMGAAVAQGFAAGGPVGGLLSLWGAAFTMQAQMMAQGRQQIAMREAEELNIVTEAIKKYGVALSNLNANWQANRAGLAKDMNDLVREWYLLKSVTTSEAVATAAMADAIEAMVAQYQELGQEVPKDLQLIADKLTSIDVIQARINQKTAELQNLLDARAIMDWKTAEEVITKYGGTLDSLGQKFVAAKQAASWKEVWDDWQTLIDMGADVGGTLQAMQDEIQALVQQSLEIGTKIPAQFKPLIEELIRTGQLFDKNGKAITDIGMLEFGAPLVSEVDKIIAAIEKLIETLNKGLAPAISNLPSLPTTGGESPEPTEPEVPGYASGGWGDFGSGRLAMLHGREAIVPLDRPSRIGAALGGGGSTVIINNPEIDSAVGLERLTRRMELALDRAARRARRI